MEQVENKQDSSPNKVHVRQSFLRRHALKLIMLLMLISAVTWWMSRSEEVEEAKPLFATVDRGDIENAVTAAGNLQPSTFVDVGAQVSGQLEKLHVDVGDTVEAGQLVAEIDATVQINRVDASRASLSALEAQLSAREASLKLAKSNADRQSRLIKEDATSQADFDAAISTLASAQSGLIQLQSQIAQSQASLASDEATLSFSTIAAPTKGTVVSVNMKEGQTLNASQQAPTILRIADLSTMTVQAEVSEADVSKLKKDMEVYFTTLGSGERRWYGKLRQILPTPTVTNNVVLYTALFDVENPDGALLSSMTTQIFFVTSSARDTLRVPLGALNFGDVESKLSTEEKSSLDNVAAAGGERSADGAARGMGGGGGGGGMGNFDPSNLTPEQQQRFRERAAAGGGRGMGRQQQQTQTTGVTTATVQFVKPDGSIEPREIKIGVKSRISAAVIEGLQEGDQVVAGIIQARTTTENNNNNNQRNNLRGFR